MVLLTFVKGLWIDGGNFDISPKALKLDQLFKPVCEIYVTSHKRSFVPSFRVWDYHVM